MARLPIRIPVLTVLIFLTLANAARAQNPYQISGTEGTIPDTGLSTTLDPSGNQKELGPLNGSMTKIGTINQATPPMMAFTNPNSQVDLNAVWVDVKKATNGDQWLYFAWKRDSNSGSGFVSIEFQQNTLAAGCVYSGTGIDFVLPQSTAETALINSCNPWWNRTTGDFIITWDQQGNTVDPQNDIKKRVFQCNDGQPGATVPYTCTLGPATSLGSAVAAISADRFSGEMAIDLTTDVFTVDRCQTFANVIPGTVTGNSDSADYKDVVFATFPPITNCGLLTVTKRTIDADGHTLVDPNNPAFGYTVANGGNRVRYDVDAPAHPIDGVAPQLEILRPNSHPAPAIHGGQTQLHTDLIPGTNYTLVEHNATTDAVTGDPIPYGATPFAIICMDGTGVGASTTLSAGIASTSTTIAIASATGFVDGDYIVIGTEKLLITAGGGTTTLTVERAQLGTAAAAHPADDTVTLMPAHTLVSPNLTFSIVVPDGVKQTDCVIIDKFVKTQPTWISGQSAKVNDSITLYNITPGASDQATAVLFRLYSNSTCTTQVTGAAGISGSLLYGDDPLNAGQKMAQANTASSGGVIVPAAGTYYWRVFYAGDKFNLPVSTTCGSETVTIAFVEPTTPQ